MSDKKILVEIKDLKKYFPVKKGLFTPNHSYVKAVDGISFTINKGETLGLVGESGCGKTTCGRTIIKLYEPTGGQIIYDGHDLSSLSPRQMLPYRRKIQMIFQDPYASLNSRMTVGDIVGESIDIHGVYKGKDRMERIQKLLRTVGLSSEHASRYPHEFSGGQRQRIGIARSLAVQPEFIICDEPISALDVSIQAQVINMLEELQEKMGLTYLFIAHDLSMVKHISDRIGVMYLGKMVEIGNGDEIYGHPMHPYTKALLSAIPIPDPEEAALRKRIMLLGEIPSPIDPPPGCRFKGRCKYAKTICSEVDPELKNLGADHFAACHLY